MFIVGLAVVSGQSFANNVAPYLVQDVRRVNFSVRGDFHIHHSWFTQLCSYELWTEGETLSWWFPCCSGRMVWCCGNWWLGAFAPTPRSTVGTLSSISRVGVACHNPHTALMNCKSFISVHFTNLYGLFHKIINWNPALHQTIFLNGFYFKPSLWIVIYSANLFFYVLLSHWQMFLLFYDADRYCYKTFVTLYQVISITSIIIFYNLVYFKVSVQYIFIYVLVFTFCIVKLLYITIIRLSLSHSWQWYFIQKCRPFRQHHLFPLFTQPCALNNNILFAHRSKL